MDSKATQSNHPPFFKEVKKKKDQLSDALNEMPNDYDRILFSGSCLRRVCPTCNIPLLFLAQTCNSCKNRVVNVWYKNVDTDSWTNPRKPPRSVPDSQPYVQCQNFAKGKKCVDIPCRFAHGQDEIEIWKLYRSLGNLGQNCSYITIDLFQNLLRQSDSLNIQKFKLKASTRCNFSSSIRRITRCNFSCNLQRNSTLGRCKIGKYTFPSLFANIFLTYQTFVTNLHLLRVELRCKLPGKLHRVTGP